MTFKHLISFQEISFISPVINPLSKNIPSSRQYLLSNKPYNILIYFVSLCLKFYSSSVFVFWRVGGGKHICFFTFFKNMYTYWISNRYSNNSLVARKSYVHITLILDIFGIMVFPRKLDWQLGNITLPGKAFLLWICLLFCFFNQRLTGLAREIVRIQFSVTFHTVLRLSGQLHWLYVSIFIEYMHFSKFLDVTK